MAMRGGDFIHNLLGFARQGEFRNVPIAFNKVLGQLHRILGRSISKGVEIEMHFSPDLLYVEGDPGQITQVFMNICLNAADAIEKRGVISITTRNVSRQDLQNDLRTTLDEEMYVEVSIRDSGKGMDTETLQRVFEPFYTTKDTGRGTGLGLSMAHGVVTRHGGNISIRSEPGVGTEVTMHFPAMKTSMQVIPTIEKPEMPGFENKVGVLLVDDEKIIRSSGARLLKKLGYEVLLAGNGAEAIEVYKQHFREIDLVLMDLGMPVMDGVECYHKLKELDPGIQVLLTSGYADAHDAGPIITSGKCDFLQKPFTVETLARAMSKALDTLPPDPLM
jgi:CheY-like chemotaxis protein